MSDLNREMQDIEQKLIFPFNVICEDSSQEKFIKMLSESDESLLNFSSDAARVLDNILGRISGTGRVDEAAFLKAFSGESIKLDRMGWQTEIHDPCCSLFWQTTPDRLKPIVSNENLFLGGFIGRSIMLEVDIEDTTLSYDDVSTLSCLLYTSPSPRDQRGSRMPSSA